MRHCRALIILLVAAVISGGCTDDILPGERPAIQDFDEGELTEVPLCLSVNDFVVRTQPGTRASEPSEVEEPVTDEEKAVYDLWVFQYDTNGNLLIKPRYYTVTDQAQLDNLPVFLKTGVTSTVYVVTNTNYPTWANDGGTAWQRFNTLEQLKKQQLPEPMPIQTGKDRIAIPMGGSVGNVTVSSGSTIEIPVTRMYAKIKIKANITVKNMTLRSFNVTDIPWTCQVESIVNGRDNDNEPTRVDFPEGTTFVSRAFAASDMDDEIDAGWTVIYVPENIRGENGNPSNQISKHEYGTIPSKSLAVEVRTEYGGEVYLYKVYPGGNDYNNFNIQRNNVYRVTVTINNVKEQHNPSSNCFIVKPGNLLSFEPYNRIETGGGYKFSDYLNPNDEDKKIDKVEIIWQTKDCIGDNSSGDRVFLGSETQDPLNRKIYVQTNKEGNALVGAYNSKGDIVWSWHIWVTGNEPDNLGKAVVYTTYDWDETGIHPEKPRIPGYSVMSCNLGALADVADAVASPVQKGERFPDSQIRTFGMLYQWGRKDPFPPVINYAAYDWIDYTDEKTEEHYANDNETLVHKTYESDESKLFHSVAGNSLTGAVKYAIAHPTVYITGTESVNYNKFTESGDWCPEGESDNKLWGGLEPGAAGQKCLLVGIDETGNDAHLFNNYGTEKSIFDPCPSGWRVAPGELWLGFTSTGLNPTSTNEFNYSKDGTTNRYGMTLYMQHWRTGPTSFFPTQGTRTYRGRGKNTGVCGNYHNATCDYNGRVNILHIHNSASLFHIFELTFQEYYVKSTAGSVRCVRDSK